MKILKWILGLVFALLLVMLIIGLTAPQIVEFDVSRTLNANQMKVYNNINEFKNWEKWSEWHKMDANMKIAYPNKTSGVGGSYSWSSESSQVGNGSMKITKSNPSYVSYDMDFGENGDGNSWFKLKPNGNKTDVVWGFKSDLGDSFITKLMFKLFGVSAIKKSYNKSLDSLEKVSQ